MRRLPWVVAGISIIALSVVMRPEVGAISTVDQGCPQVSSQTDHQGTTLQGFAAGTTGVVYDGSDKSLQLKKEGGIFSSTFFTATGTPQYTCSADFDKDGWADFAAATADGRYFGFYKNKTSDNLAAYPPNWTNPSYVLPPKFTLLGNANFYDAGFTSSGGGAAACGDFNGDGNQDFAVVLEDGDDGGVATFARMFLGNGNGTFQTPYNLTTNWTTDFQNLMWDGNMVTVDYNGDGKKDLLFGAWDSGGGFVRVFLNNGASPPKFTPSTYLVQNAGLGTKGVQAVAYADFTGDGYKDLVISSKTSDKLKIYFGLAGGGVSGTAQVITSLNQAAILLAADFSLDGKIDLIVATDGNSGQVWYYKNTGNAATPFSTYTVIPESFSDFDTGFFFNYDNDPESTPDLMLADGNGAGYSTFANRVVATYVQCGDVASGVLDLGDLASKEMVVTAARLTPTATLPSGTTITYYMSNEEPEVWQATSACTDVATDRCVTFPQPIGRTVRWKATMCSNSTKTVTPKITDIKIKFNYTLAQEHFRGGVVVDDGVAYVGAFRQPGDRGHFYAANAGLDQIYWDSATKLDAMADSSRKIYTANTSGTSRLDFDTTAASQSALQATLGVASQTQAQSVITWQRSARFGIAGGGIVKTKLGSVETSTPAVISPPTKPLWYNYLTSQQKQEVNSFIQTYATRPVLVLFGSKDAPLHAVRNKPSDITSSTNGNEAWAFIPAKVAAGLVANQAAGTATSYVDGSPTLADVRLSDGALHTVAIVPGGNGSSAVFALDVTNTVSSSGTVTGPTPLWETLPGDTTAGIGHAKPAIARVKVGGAEKYYAILATGFAADNPTTPYTKGRDVIAIDIATGARAWRFKTACPVTSDPVVFETDDEAEPGDPALDGFADRLVLADACGYVYKLDPAVNLPGSLATDGWINSSTFGSISTGTTDAAGHAVRALFSTRYTTGAIGGSSGERPIAGTIGARADASGRLILFFGTGGLESFDPSKVNEFYAVYADTGAIRNKITGHCASGRCEKFYGGVVVSTDQVILTRATDPPIATTTCEFGTSEVTGVDVDDLSTQLAVTTTSATVSSLYGHAGAVYFTTLSGELRRVGTPATTSAGGESSGGDGGSGGSGGDDDGSGGVSRALGVMGWRQVL